MSYQSYRGYEPSKQPCYIVTWGLQWQIIESQRLEAGADLRAAMDAAIARVTADGWESEREPDFGFTFIRRNNVRRLLALTPRDPLDKQPQSFNPYR